MERLTNKREADAQRKEYKNRVRNGYPRNIPEERFLRLAAYEDTGLTPGDIKKWLCRKQTRFCGLKLLDEELHTIKNELCQYCGKYKQAHEGACDGCRWREM